MVLETMPPAYHGHGTANLPLGHDALARPACFETERFKRIESTEWLWMKETCRFLPARGMQSTMIGF
jgi:hypothetical protein